MTTKIDYNIALKFRNIIFIFIKIVFFVVIFQRGYLLVIDEFDYF